MEVSGNNPVGSLDSMRNNEIKSISREVVQNKTDEEVQLKRQTETDRVEIENKDLRDNQREATDSEAVENTKAFNDGLRSGQNIDFIA